MPANFTFSGDLPGPKLEACDASTPTDCFDLFLNMYYDELLCQTNLYVDQQRAAKGDTTPWTPISKEKLLTFIGINIAMGVVSLPSPDDYWSTNIVRSHPWFCAIMSRDRFRLILSYIHVAENSKAPQCDDPGFDQCSLKRYFVCKWNNLKFAWRKKNIKKKKRAKRKEYH